eukprot:524111_1
MAELNDFELRESNFRVKVIDRQRKSPLPLVYHESEFYVIAEAGREFEVEVGVVNQFQTSGKQLICDLDVDGRGVGYRKLIDYACRRHNRCHCCHRETFEWFCLKEGDFRNLKFNSIRRSSEEPSPKKRKMDDIGVLKLKFHQARIPTAPCPPGCPGEYVYAEARRQPRSDSIELGDVECSPEAKKFWKNPSLSVAAGKPTTAALLCNHRSAKAVNLIKTIIIHYDTADRLRLRGILNPIGNPAHRKYFRNFSLNESLSNSFPSSSVSSSSAPSSSVPSGSVPSGSVPSGSAPSGSVPSSSSNPAGSGRLPAVEGEAWNCVSCSHTNGPLAKKCMFCGTAQENSTNSSILSVKREREREHRRKRNREVFEEVVTCDLSVESPELQFYSQIVPRERAESVTVEE